ncbi:MAG: VWA domain-containing protein, partial [Pseudomonadales bacterium]|nr:VWA domain-containing protein [Pseudomonadales bacterium]
MEKTLGEFVQALRNSDVRVSTSETIDAIRVINIVGLKDKSVLKNALRTALSKSDIEKENFDHCFDNFFSFARLNEFKAKTSPEELAEISEPAEDASGLAEEGGGGSGSGNGEGGGGEVILPESAEDLDALLEERGLVPQSSLAKLLLNGGRANLTIALAEAARAVKLNNIKFFTQKGLYTRKIMVHIGLEEMEQEMFQLEKSDDIYGRALGRKIRGAREYLRSEVRDYVEKQFLVVADAEGKELKDEITRHIKLTNIELRGFSNIKKVVQKMAKRLISMHSRRKRVKNRGVIDIRKTLRKNAANDGVLFDLHWKSTKVDRPKVIVICDVSGSVREVSRFLLMFIYSITEVLPNVRAFAFSGRMFEVTKIFKEKTLEKAVEQTLDDYGFGSTDYGQSLQDFKDICFDDIDNRTTIIILGDARNNNNPNREEILEEIYNRARQVIWLNPEDKSHWRAGDSEMRNYAVYCHMVEVCNSLAHL